MSEVRVKVRFITGTVPPVVINIPSSEPISSLLEEIKHAGKIFGAIEIKHGYPPRVLDLSIYPPETPLESLPFKLNGEQLLVRCLGVTSTPQPGPHKSTPKENKPPNIYAPQPSTGDPPDVLLPGRGTVMLRVMEDDNSCLFRALSYLLTNGITSPTELRQIVTETIQGDQLTYNEAVLGDTVNQYCKWINMESSWGGGIELSILAKFFDIEIIAIDVSTLSIMHFNDPHPRFCIVVYSGIHYDALALSPITAYSFSSPSPDQDVRMFDRGDDGILTAARELVGKLKEKKYFTDTRKFTLRCEVCGKALVGEEEARGHAKRSGHMEFGEY